MMMIMIVNQENQITSLTNEDVGIGKIKYKKVALLTENTKNTLSDSIHKTVFFPKCF